MQCSGFETRGHNWPPTFNPPKSGAEWERSLAFNCLIVKDDARCQYRAEQSTKTFCRASQARCHPICFLVVFLLAMDWWINCTTSWGRGRPIQWSRTCTRWPVCAIPGVSLTCIMNNENSCSILIVMIWIHRKARVVYPCSGKANKHVDNKGAKWNKDAVSRTAPGPGFVLPGHRRRGLPRGYADTAGTTTVRRSAAAPRWAGSGWHFDRNLSSVGPLICLSWADSTLWSSGLCRRACVLLRMCHWHGTIVWFYSVFFGICPSKKGT